jgi:hypothetical protein
MRLMDAGQQRVDESVARAFVEHRFQGWLETSRRSVSLAPLGRHR